MKHKIWFTILFIVGVTYTSNTDFIIKPDKESSIKILIIQNVNIINMDNNKLLEEHDLKIINDKIVQIDQDIEVTEDADMLDLSGQFLIPALFDMHAHINTQNPWHDYHLALYKYFGIHHVNIMTGNDRLIELQQASREQFENFSTPKIYLASELIDGDPPLWGDRHPGPIITKPKNVETSLTELKKKGYNDIKVYNQLNEEVYLEILDIAKKLDLNVVGHIPFDLSTEHQLDKRHQRIEHLEGYLNLAYEGKPDTLPTGYRRTPLLLDGFDSTKMVEAARLTVERDIWNTPTHVLFTSLVDSSYTNEVMNGTISKLLDPQLERAWSQVINNKNQMPHLRSDKFRDVHLKMISILHEEGAKLLAGTDAAQPVLLYGHSLHKELQYFVMAGMTPFEALKTATVNPAKYLGLEKQGKLIEGFKAEMVVLKENPLENIAHTLSIEGYISDGNYMRKNEMRSELSTIKEEIE